MDTLNHLARQRGRWLEFQDILYGYRRVDPLHGAEYILDVLLLYKKFRGKRVTVPVRRHAYLQQSFAPLEGLLDEEWRRWVKQGSPTHNLKSELDRQQLFEVAAVEPSGSVTLIDETRINIVLPLSGRSEAFLRFVDHFHSLCVEGVGADKNVHLMVVLFLAHNPHQHSAHTQSEEEVIKSSLQRLREKAGGERVRWLEIPQLPFSRGLALAKGAAALPPHSLLFFADADILFSRESLRRIRRNTVRGRQVFFPIVFSEFEPSTWDNPPPAYDKSVYDTNNWNMNPALQPVPEEWNRGVFGDPHEEVSEKEGEVEVGTHFVYGERRGYFRHFGFGLVSLFRSDLERVGGVETGIQGWGLEDVNLYEKCLFNASLSVLRAVEPGLVHVYHPVLCDRNLSPSQYDMCLGSRFASYASLHSLADRVHKEERYSHLFSPLQPPPPSFKKRR